ncbi:histidine kinase [Chitinophaga parva]|uniref:histidine kinase n=1 Tax=Chitinophaga parva TaxID=2169414 RepID=A0A2T7BBV2_9BACT|nr:ATP-binding protein [Chitinophaga parva]PUZ21857.1 histidine kinase [Chitinophaga parva]
MKTNVMTRHPLFTNGGKLGDMMAAKDWSQTSLGDVEEWPQSLKTCVRIILTSRQPMFVWWGKDLVNLYNDAYCDILGGKHPRVLGIPAAEVWSEIWDTAIAPRVKKCLEDAEGTYDEALRLIMHRNGFPEETYYTFSYSPVPGDDGQAAGIICANTDDTQRIVNERQLHTLRDLGKIVLDIKDAPSLFAATINVLRKNPADFPFACLYGIQPDGQHALLVDCTQPGQPGELFPGMVNITDEAAPWLLAQVARSGKPAIARQLQNLPAGLGEGPWEAAPEQALILPVLRSGQPAPEAVLIIGLNPFRPLNEQYQGFFQLVTDQLAAGLSSIYAYEAERKRAEALAAIDQAKTAFFSNVSHEFRTPLTLMLAPLESLLQQPPTSSLGEHMDNIEATHRNALRLLRLVNTLLDFSRMEAGRTAAQYSPVDLGAFTTDLASNFRAVIEQAGLLYDVYCEPQPEPVYVDMEMWEKIVLNLLSNAFKYTLQGKILVTLNYEQDQAVLRVVDTGVGIPETEIPHMFERFHRVEHSAGRTHEGTGIGLSLVQELVTLHGGTIHVSSVLGKGSVFTVTIPTGTGHLPASQITGGPRVYHSRLPEMFLREVLSMEHPLSPERMDAGEIPATHGFTASTQVLVVDDNADMRAYIQRLLQPYVQLRVAANGRQALDLIRERRPDLVISDVMMPVMDGITMLHTLKAHTDTADIPVIMLSARAGEESRIEGYELGADDYLIKPFSAKELLARVRSQLRLHKSRQYAAQQLRHIFAQAPVAISLFLGPEHRVEIANDTMLEITGRTHEQLVGRPLLEALPELKDQGIGPMLDEAFSGKRVQAKERALQLMHNGVLTERYHSFVYEPFRDEDGNITGLLAVANDVTELVQARQLAQSNAQQLEKMVAQRTRELKASNEALQQTNEELEQFAYVSSHDLQEPLRKIQTFSDLVMHSAGKPGFIPARYFEKMHQAAARMSALITDLLSFSRLSRVEEPFMATDLEQVLGNVRIDYEMAIREKGAVISADPLPVIHAIPVQMQQLFSNLIGNALKFAEKAPRIRIRAAEATPEQVAAQPSLDKHQRYLRLQFADNGIGFDQVYAEQIFTIFQRLHDRRTYQGTGIGLAICKKIVLRHRGAISAEASEEKGACFQVYLPW